jgi:hypothetical protein
MPATVIATIAATKKKSGREDVETVFQIVVFARDERWFRFARRSRVWPVSRDKKIVLGHSHIVYRK